MKKPKFDKSRLHEVVSNDNVDELYQELLEHEYVDSENLINEKCLKLEDHAELGISNRFSGNFFDILNLLKEQWIWFEIQPFSLPLYFIRELPEGIEFVRSATCSIVRTGQKIFLVTNNHVWNKFNELKDEDSNLIIGIGRGNGEQLFLITKPEVLDQEEKVDLVTLSFNNIDKLDLGKKKAIERGVMVSAQKGDVACFLGYPEAQKYILDNKSGICSLSWNVSDFVSSTGEKHFVMVDEQGDRRMSVLSSRYDPNGCLSGISGTPVFLIRKGDFEFGGIVYESDRQGGRSTFYVVHANFIDENGSIDRNRICW